MRKVCVLIFSLILGANVQAQNVRAELSDQEQVLSDRMRQDNEFEPVGCSRRPRAIDPSESTARRLKTFEALSRQHGKAKIKMTCGTKEGDPIFSYLTVEKGKASIVVDTSHDEFGPRRVTTYACDKLEIGRYFNDLKLGKMVFDPIDSTPAAGEQISLRCLANNIEVIF